MAALDRPVSAPANGISYLELLAYLGMTRHLGGWEATRELAQTCRIGQGKHILDVGCGVGRTPVIYAKKYGCRVTGIDLSPRMVEWSRQRVCSERLAGRVEVRAADAQQLPFEDELFDAVVTESVLVFVPDRRKALDEFVRVTRPGGFIGLNETCSLKTPIPPEISDALSGGIFGAARLEPAGTWKELLAAAGLQDVQANLHTLTARQDVRDRMKWFGVKGVLINLYHMLQLSLSNPALRREIGKFMALQRKIPQNLYEYYSYGIFAGRK
jgi:arsenite methyltransferase